MAVIPVNYLWGFLPLGRDPINYARNHIGPSGSGARDTAEYANYLLGGRKKVLFRKSIRPTQAIASTADESTWRWAGHTGPLTTALNCKYVAIPLSGADYNNASRTYIVMQENLTGAGTSTTNTSLYMTDEDEGTIVPDDYRLLEQEFAITADTDYRFTLHVENGMRIISLTVSEINRLTVDTSTDTSAVDSTKFYQGGWIHDAPVTDIFDAADKVWKRNGKTLVTWSVAGTTAVTRSSATAANIFDQAVTTYGASTPGFPCVVTNSHSFDSNNVGVTMYCYASIPAGSGKVKFLKDGGGELGSMTVNSSTAQFWTTTGNLDGTLTSDKLDIHIEGDGTNALSCWAAGAFLHVA